MADRRECHLRLNSTCVYHHRAQGAFAMTHAWTSAQQWDILAKYRRTWILYCPHDHTSLRVDRGSALADPHAVQFSCPTCGNAVHLTDSVSISDADSTHSLARTVLPLGGHSGIDRSDRGNCAGPVAIALPGSGKGI